MGASPVQKGNQRKNKEEEKWRENANNRERFEKLRPKTGTDGKN